MRFIASIMTPSIVIWNPLISTNQNNDHCMDNVCDASCSSHSCFKEKKQWIHMLLSNEQKLCQLGMTVRFEWSTYSDLAAAAAAPSHRIWDYNITRADTPTFPRTISVQIKLRHESQQHSRSSSCPPASSPKLLQKGRISLTQYNRRAWDMIW